MAKTDPTTTADYRALLRLQKSEAEFQAEIVQLATENGWRHYHTHDSRRSVSGFPDLELSRRDQGTFHREIKSATGECSVDQMEWLVWISETIHGDARVWWPWDWDEIEEMLTTPLGAPRTTAKHRGPGLNLERKPPQ